MADYMTSQRRRADLRINMPQTPKSAPYLMPWDDDLPVIDNDESFADVVAKFIGYITKAVDAAYSYEQLRTTFAGQSLKPMIFRLSDECHHPAVVAALLAAKYIYKVTNDEGTGLTESRGLACEIVAWQFLTFLSERELIDYLLYEVPDLANKQPGRKLSTLPRGQQVDSNHDPRESTPLLQSQSRSQTCADAHGASRPSESIDSAHAASPINESEADDAANDAASDSILRSLVGMNALEVAGVASAKRFLSQRPVQKIVDDIWSGNVIFWESLNVEAVRHPRTYNKRVADPFTRLRVPRYQKAFQVGFYLSFLALFYAVLVGPITQHVTLFEGLLYLWMASFAYDEIGEIQDAGLLFYRVDFWSIWDLGIVAVSVAFIVLRICGKVKQSDYVMDVAFDVLSLVAVFLVPRIFSVMSLIPYFGTLIPVLKEMTKAFLKFLPVILVLYLGFLTSFTMLAREHMTIREVSWVLVEVFFGSSFLGFDFAFKISPYFGYPLMLIFVCLTNIVLITSLVSLVSNSLSEKRDHLRFDSVMAHARTEYLFQYSIYVLESSSSRRLTYFMPPLNLIPLLLLRPLRLVLPTQHIRRIRIVLLKATHAGFVALIWIFEGSIRLVTRVNQPRTSFTRPDQLTPRPLSAGLQIERERYARRPWHVSTLTKATTTNASVESASGIAEAEVVKLLQKLSAQVDELSALLAEQQQKE